MKGEMLIINIKLIGANSHNGIKMKKILERTIDNSDIDINLIISDDDKNKYNIKNYPGIIINDTLVSQGKVLSEREIKKSIELLV